MHEFDFDECCDSNCGWFTQGRGRGVTLRCSLSQSASAVWWPEAAGRSQGLRETWPSGGWPASMDRLLRSTWEEDRSPPK